MVFHPSHRPLEIATRFPQFHSPDDDDISPTNKKHSSYRGGHFYWALTGSPILVDRREGFGETVGAGPCARPAPLWTAAKASPKM